jgi:hypothetical protein
MPAERVGAAAGLGRRVGARLLHELREALPPTIFFFVGFNLIACWFFFSRSGRI